MSLEPAADRAYDDGKLIRDVWDDWQALPIFDIRNCRKDRGGVQFRWGTVMRVNFR